MLDLVPGLLLMGGEYMFTNLIIAIATSKRLKIFLSTFHSLPDIMVAVSL